MNGDKNVFRQKFTRIEGLSSIRRLPRLGKIRLGIKVEYGGLVQDSDGVRRRKTRPKEVDYFVCPAEIKKVIGDEPKELNIMFPLNDPETLFPQAYKWYGSSKGLKCRGDGVNALRLNEETNEMEERGCPCELLESGKCKQRASLSFLMPGIKIGGVYQIDLSSYHSIVDINSGFDYAIAMLGGRIAMVPFILRRVPKETHNEGKKQIHYTLQLELDITVQQAQQIREGQNIYVGQRKQYEIEAPKEDINPAYDSKEDGAVIEEETEEEKKARETRVEEKQEALIKEHKESKANEVRLKKEIEEGKHKLKSYEEAKAIYKKKQGEKEVVVEPATKEQMAKIKKDIIESPLLNEEEYFKLNDLIKKGMNKAEADTAITWWSRVKPLRKKEKEKEKEAEPAEVTKEEKMKVANNIVKTGGKLEVKNDKALFPDEEIVKPEDMPD